MNTILQNSITCSWCEIFSGLEYHTGLGLNRRMVKFHGYNCVRSSILLNKAI